MRRNRIIRLAALSCACRAKTRANSSRPFHRHQRRDAKRIWSSSGRADRGSHSAARETFWNIRADKGEFKVPNASDFPLANVIGLKSLEPNMTADGLWIEPLDDAATPPDLYEAQRNY